MASHKQQPRQLSELRLDGWKRWRALAYMIYVGVSVASSILMGTGAVAGQRSCDSGSALHCRISQKRQAELPVGGGGMV
jgi:hypothetical protein